MIATLLIGTDIGPSLDISVYIARVLWAGALGLRVQCPGKGALAPFPHPRGVPYSSATSSTTRGVPATAYEPGEKTCSSSNLGI